MSSESINNSFVVSDNYQSDEEERERDKISFAIMSQKERWGRDSDLKEYEMICLYENTPLTLNPNELLIGD
jgi:hypothetical protein